MASTDTASEAQVDYVRGLLRTKETEALAPSQQSWLEENATELQRLTRGQISRVINGLKGLPARARQHAGPGAEVPDGRYAVTEADGILRFYRVATPSAGRWAGFTFIDVQASDELYKLRDRTRKGIVLALIATNPKAAMLRYGIELGHCGHCGRTLTNEVSRSYGIGPICRGKMGWQGMPGEATNYDYEYCNDFGSRHEDKGFRHIRIFNVNTGKNVEYVATEKEALERIDSLECSLNARTS